MIESLKQRGHQRRSCSAQAAAQSKPGLQWSGESGIKEIVLPWEALLLSGILRGCAAQNRAFTPSCSISAIEGKDNSPCLWIGRLTVGQSKGSNPLTFAPSSRALSGPSHEERESFVNRRWTRAGNPASEMGPKLSTRVSAHEETPQKKTAGGHLRVRSPKGSSRPTQSCGLLICRFCP